MHTAHYHRQHTAHHTLYKITHIFVDLTSLHTTISADKPNPLRAAQLKDAAKRGAANSSADGGKSTVGGIQEEAENSLEAVIREAS